MRTQTIQTSGDWIRRNIPDEDYGSAICLNFPKYAESLKVKIKTEAAREHKSISHFIRDCCAEKIREQEKIRRDNEALRGALLWTT